jgi:tetratricopeptide (TPR) repeat protein
VRKVDVSDLKTKDSLVAITPRDRDLITKFLASALRLPIPPVLSPEYVKLGDFDTALRDLQVFFAGPSGRPIVDRSRGDVRVFIIQFDENVTVLARNRTRLPGTLGTIEIQENGVALAKVRYGNPLPSGSAVNSISAQTGAQKSELSEIQKQQVQQAQTQIEDGQYNEAIATANTFIESNPQLETGYFLRGFAYIGLEDANSAIADLEKSASISEREGRPEKAAEAREIVKKMQGD